MKPRPHRSAAATVSPQFFVLLRIFVALQIIAPVSDAVAQPARGASAAASMAPIAARTPGPGMQVVVQVTVTPAGTSMHAIVDALGQEATRIFGPARLFELQLGLGDYAGDAAAQRALAKFDCDARFAIAADDGGHFLDASWLPGMLGLATIARTAFACDGTDCGGAATTPEPPSMHPVLAEWTIDRGPIAQAVAAHQELFGDGLMNVTVTSAIRARTDAVVFGAGGARSAMLFGLSDNHPVVVIVGTPHRCDVIRDGEYWTGYLCGNYLVIDGIDGGDLDAGPYHEFHQED